MKSKFKNLLPLYLISAFFIMSCSAALPVIENYQTSPTPDGNEKIIRLYENKIDSLNNLIKINKNKIAPLEKENDYLKSCIIKYNKKIDQLKFNISMGEKYICTEKFSFVLNRPNGSVVDKLLLHDTVKVIESIESYYKIIYNDKLGYVVKYKFKSEKEILEEIRLAKLEKEKKEKGERAESLEKIRAENEKRNAEIRAENEKRNAEIRAENEKRNAEIRAENEKRNAERLEKENEERAARRESLLIKYNLSIVDKILNGEIWIGMTSQMAKESIGSPDNVNRNVYSFGVHEQWIYKRKYSKDRYLYFENGVLTSWQE